MNTQTSCQPKPGQTLRKEMPLRRILISVSAFGLVTSLLVPSASLAEGPSATLRPIQDPEDGAKAPPPGRVGFRSGVVSAPSDVDFFGSAVDQQPFPNAGDRSPLGDDESGIRAFLDALGAADAGETRGTTTTHILRLSREISESNREILLAAIQAAGATPNGWTEAPIPFMFIGSTDADLAPLLELSFVEGIEDEQFYAAASTREVQQRTSNVPWNVDRVDQRSAPLDGTFNFRETGQGVTAYIVDTGIAYDPFRDFVLDWRDEISYAPPGLDGVAWWDDGSQDAESVKWFDCNGHGTHVAGTLADPVLGIAPGVDLVVVKASTGCAGGFALSALLAGFSWIASDYIARGSGPAVVNLSLGGEVDDVSEFFDDQVRALIDQGMTVVVAAGNSGQNACGVSPARMPRAITVAASNIGDGFASFSNRGSCVDLVAPGVDVPSFAPIYTQECQKDLAGFAWLWLAYCNADGVRAAIQVVQLSGTSMATPLVAGAAALQLAFAPNSSPAQVKEALERDATPVVRGLPAATPNRLLHTGFRIPNAARISVNDIGVIPSSVKSQVTALALSVKAFRSDERGVIAVFPCDATANQTRVSSDDMQPFTIGQTTVVTAVSASGDVCVEVRNGRGERIGLDRALIYVTGWFTGGGFTPVSPIRARDTREDGFEDVSRVRVKVDEVLQIPQADRSEVRGLALSVKVFNPSQRAVIAVFPCDAPASQTRVSSDDVPERSIGQATVLSAVSAQREVCVEARTGSGDQVPLDRIIVYVTGWFTGDGFTPVSPIRASDSRDDGFEDISRSRVRVGTIAQIPSHQRANVTALSLSVKVFRPSERGIVAVFPCDAPASQTRVSSNDVPSGTIGQITVLSAVSAAGETCVEVRDNGGRQIPLDRTIVYVTGWFIGDGKTAVSPFRASDSND